MSFISLIQIYCKCLYGLIKVLRSQWRLQQDQVIEEWDGLCLENDCLLITKHMQIFKQVPLQDEINEISLNNKATLNALYEKFPNNPSINCFLLVGTEEYEASRYQLQQLDMDIVTEMYQSAVRTLDIVMSEQRLLDQLALKLNKELISPKHQQEYQKQLILHDWGQHQDMDSLIQDLCLVNYQIQQYVSQSRVYQQQLCSQNYESDSYREKYIKALNHITILEEQLNTFIFDSCKSRSQKSLHCRRKQIENIENRIDKLSQKLESNIVKGNQYFCSEAINLH